MKISTRVRYGVRLMLVLASNHQKGPVLLKNIAMEEDISEKYLSLIVLPLKAKGLIHATRGSRGGYLLAKPPEQISLKEIAEILDGETCLVNCVKDKALCPRATLCASRELWAVLGTRISEVLNSFTLADMLRVKREKLEGAGLNYAV